MMNPTFNLVGRFLMFFPCLRWEAFRTRYFSPKILYLVSKVFERLINNNLVTFLVGLGPLLMYSEFFVALILLLTVTTVEFIRLLGNWFGYSQCFWSYNVCDIGQYYCFWKFHQSWRPPRFFSWSYPLLHWIYDFPHIFI